MKRDRIRLGALSTLHCADYGVSQVFHSLCSRWCGPELFAQMVVPSSQPQLRRSNLVEAVPPLLRSWYYRQPHRPVRAAEKRFLRTLRKFDAVYLFPGVSLETIAGIKAAGKPIVLERVNCQIATAQAILDEAYAKLGLPANHGRTAAVDRHERQELELADFLFCPSPAVAESFRAIGVPASKLLLTTEGWEPQNFPLATAPQPASKELTEELTVLFVGSLCVRKGVHLLLRAWEQAQIKGRLILIGNLEAEIAQTCGDLLSRPDVTQMGFRGSYRQFYAQADVFAIASLEEGSPLVTYEALGHGLPVLASPMGAGGVVRDGVEGLVVPPYDQEAWVAALQRLAASPELRQQMSNSARQKAATLTWDKVAAQRAEQLLTLPA